MRLSTRPSPHQEALFELLGALSRGNETLPSTWSEASDAFIAAVRDYLGFILGDAPLAFPERADTEGEHQWVPLLACLVHGDIAGLQSLAALEELPGSGGPMALMTGALFKEAGFDDAAECLLEEGIPYAAAERRSDLWIELAQLLTKRANHERARDMLRRAVTEAGDDPRRVLRACRELLRVGAIDDAYVVLEEWSHRHPDHPGILFTLAELSHVAGDFETSTRLFDRVDALDPGRADVAAARGALAVSRGDYQRAAALLSERWAADPSDWVTGTWLTETYLRLGDDAKAGATHKEARAVHDSPIHCLLQAAMAVPEELATNAELPGLLEAWDEGWSIADCLAEDAPFPARRRALETLASFRGSRGENLVRVSDEAQGPTGVVPVPTERPDPLSESRLQSADAVKRIVTESPQAVLERFAGIEAAFPDSPHPFCYRGEIRLWLGDYEGALADFAAAVERKTARWGFIGKAAVHLLEGRRDAALAEIAACNEHFQPVPSATTGIYLGESERRVGHLEESVALLSESVRVKPGRLSGWINLALSHLALGHEERARELFADVGAKAPRLLWDAARALDATKDQARETWSPRFEDMVPLFEKSLELMRGNRSSHTMTYFDADGRFRQVRDARTWKQKAGRLRSHLWDETRRRCF
jgi:tetratricopeptide (TPR) repeat protein